MLKSIWILKELLDILGLNLSISLLSEYDNEIVQIDLEEVQTE